MGHPSATRQVDPCIAPWDGFLRRSVPFGSWWTGEDARLSINNRHRGKGRPFAPATPPDMRVRIRRFSSVELERREQAWNAERVKVRNGKRERQRRAVR